VSAGPPRPDHERVAEVFAEALEHPPAERAAFLDAACGESPAVRGEVESLLAASAQAGEFMHTLDMAQGAALLEAAAEPEPPRARAGPYRMLRELGRGGMGVVYLAERAEGFEQRAAVKLVKRGMDSEAIVQRFLRERQILAGLEHPNVARLLDGGLTEDGQPYFAMEYVEGLSLTEYSRRHRLAVEERLRLFEEACRAVQHAHGRLVVHRDLKPSNMLVTADGQLKLLDFGVAKLLAETEDAGLTETGVRLLTPQYAAPEQVRGAPVTTATDVYALGVVLYELLAGQRPFAAEEKQGTTELLRAVCEMEPRPPSLLLADQPRLARRLRGDLDTVVLKAVDKEPARRYASAEALADDVRRHREGRPVLARRDTVAYRVAKFVRRHKVGVAAATFAAVSLLLGVAGVAWQAAVASRERDHARQEAARAEKVKEFLVDLFEAADPAESKGEAVTARELLDRGAARIEGDLAGHPALQAELFDVVAGISQELGRYDRARRLAELSLEQARRAHGPQHVQVARSMDTLATVLHRSGDYPGSEDLRRQALAMRRALLPADSAEVADSLEGLGLVLRVRAKLDEAEARQREALAIREKGQGPDHPATAGTLANLADVLHARGDFAAAAELHRRVLRIRRAALGEVHPRVAASTVALGSALLQQGDLAGAEEAHRQALAQRRRLFGEEHPLVAESLHHLAATLHTAGDLPGAETLYRQALAMDRKLKGEAHRDVAVGSTNLAFALAQQGRFEEAMPLFARATELNARVNGPDHPLLARALERQAAALIDQGRAREALPLVERSLAIGRARYGAQHPSLAVGLGVAAAARAELGQPAEAERLFRESLDMQRRVRPRPHATTAEILTGLGEVLVRQDRAAEAEPLLREALSQADRTLPATHWRRGEVESVLGACLSRVGRGQEGLALLTAGYERLRDARGAAHPATRRALRRLETAQRGGGNPQ
jgi:eukaryotic-like serine/threonine-protein kinase